MVRHVKQRKERKYRSEVTILQLRRHIYYIYIYRYIYIQYILYKYLYIVFKYIPYTENTYVLCSTSFFFINIKETL